MHKILKSQTFLLSKYISQLKYINLLQFILVQVFVQHKKLLQWIIGRNALRCGHIVKMHYFPKCFTKQAFMFPTFDTCIRMISRRSYCSSPVLPVSTLLTTCMYTKHKTCLYNQLYYTVHYLQCGLWGAALRHGMCGLVPATVPVPTCMGCPALIILQQPLPWGPRSTLWRRLFHMWTVPQNEVLQHD